MTYYVDLKKVEEQISQNERKKNSYNLKNIYNISN